MTNKKFFLYFWMIKEGVQVSLGTDTSTDYDAARRLAMRAARRGYHCNVISGGRLVYAQ